MILAHLQKGGRCGFAFSVAEPLGCLSPHAEGGAQSFSGVASFPVTPPSVRQPTSSPTLGAEGAARHTEAEQAHGRPCGSPRISAA